MKWFQTVELTTLPDRWPAMAYSNEVTRMRVSNEAMKSQISFVSLKMRNDSTTNVMESNQKRFTHPKPDFTNYWHSPFPSWGFRIGRVRFSGRVVAASPTTGSDSGNTHFCILNWNRVQRRNGNHHQRIWFHFSVSISLEINDFRVIRFFWRSCVLSCCGVMLTHRTPGWEHNIDGRVAGNYFSKCRKKVGNGFRLSVGGAWSGVDCPFGAIFFLGLWQCINFQLISQ